MRPSRKVKAPPQNVEFYTVPEFCYLHRISITKYYRLRAKGLAPRGHKAGGTVLISREDAAAWRNDLPPAA